MGSGGAIVMDENTCMVDMARFFMEFVQDESCGKCTPCRIGSTRGLETIDKIADGIEPEKNRELVEDLCSTMKYGSLCALGGFTPYPVVSAMTHFPEDFGLGGTMEAAE
jgi:formate dehydrogenase iron-sulfur subunit